MAAASVTRAATTPSLARTGRSRALSSAQIAHAGQRDGGDDTDGSG